MNNSGNLVESLKDIFNRKISYYFEINGIPDEGGINRYKLASPIELASNITFYLCLCSFQATSFFTNIDEKNNKFYYKKDKDEKVILLPTGSFEISNINNEIVYSFLGDNTKNAVSPIRITLNKASGYTYLFLDDKYEVDFTKSNNFRNILGFESKICKDKINISNTMADVVLTNKIYISCSIVEGSYDRNGVRRQVFFSFANSYRYGELININIKNLQFHALNVDRIDEILFTFCNEKNEPINFNKSQVIMSVLVQQV